MRTDAYEQMSDIAYGEASNDEIIPDVIALQVVMTDGAVTSFPVTSNALRYLLIDELGLGLGRSRDVAHVVHLEVTLPSRQDTEREPS